MPSVSITSANEVKASLIIAPGYLCTSIDADPPWDIVLTLELQKMLIKMLCVVFVRTHKRLLEWWCSCKSLEFSSRLQIHLSKLLLLAESAGLFLSGGWILEVERGCSEEVAGVLLPNIVKSGLGVPGTILVAEDVDALGGGICREGAGEEGCFLRGLFFGI